MAVLDLPDVPGLLLQLSSNIAQFERDGETTVLIKNIHELVSWKTRNHIMSQSGQDPFL